MNTALAPQIQNTFNAPQKNTGISLVATIPDSPIGTIQLGLMSLSPSDPIPSAVIISNPSPDKFSRPLGVGIFSDVAYIAFKNKWDMVDGKPKLEKTHIIGTAQELSEFQQIMKAEMLSSKTAAFRSGGSTMETLGEYFIFHELNSSGQVIIENKGRTANLQIRKLENTPAVTAELVEGQQTTISQTEYLTTFEKSVETLSEKVLNQHLNSNIFKPTVGRPALQILGSANLLSPEDNTCKVIYDSRGKGLVMDFGIPLERFIEKGGDPKVIDSVLLSHNHADHLIGLADFLAFRHQSYPSERTTLIGDPWTLNFFRKQMESVMGTKHVENIFSRIDLINLKSDDGTKYTSVSHGNFEIKAQSVRHVVESEDGSSKTLGYKITTSFQEGNSQKFIAYADTGDTQLGNRYLTHYLMALGEFLKNAQGGNFNEVDARNTLKRMLPFATTEERKRIGVLTAKPSILEDLSEIISLVRQEHEFATKALRDTVRKDASLTKLMAAGKYVSEQVNYVDVGGGIGFLEALPVVRPSNGDFLTGKAGMLHASGTDAMVFMDEVEEASCVNGTIAETTWLAGHCPANSSSTLIEPRFEVVNTSEKFGKVIQF